MFGLFTGKKAEVDVLANAMVRARREKNEDAAVRKFLETIRADEKVMRELRDTSRLTVTYLCERSGIHSESVRQSLHAQMESLWEQSLNRAVREYLRDHRTDF